MYSVFVCAFIRDGYFATLSRLLQLAPRNRNQNPPLCPPALPFSSPRAQSILVTHYIDSPSIIGRPRTPTKNSSTADSNNNVEQKRDSDSPANSCPSWALEEEEEDVNIASNSEVEDEELKSKSSDPATATNVPVALPPRLTSDVPMPWPGDHDSSHHDSFLEASDMSLCLEIASGAAPYHAAKWIRSTTTANNKNRPDVLLPGSLRERGEFCLVELGLMESRIKGLRRRSFCWKVVDVEFRRLNEFPE